MLSFCREVHNQLSGGDWLNLARAMNSRRAAGSSRGPTFSASVELWQTLLAQASLHAAAVSRRGREAGHGAGRGSWQKSRETEKEVPSDSLIRRDRKPS